VGLSATTLREQQRWLLDAVTQPVTALDAPCAVPLNEHLQRLRGGETEAALRLGIYRHAYFARLVECLADDYPAVLAMLGERDFEALALSFIGQFPSQSPSLNLYGARFPRHCRHWPDPRGGFVADLARLEWAIVEVIHAESRAVIGDLTPGAGRAADSLRFVPNPALRLLTFDHDVGAVYQHLQMGDGVAADVPLAPQPSSLVVCRVQDRIWRVGVPGEELGLLRLLLRGVPLGCALTQVSAHVPLDPEVVQRAFSNWVSCGFFSGVA